MIGNYAYGKNGAQIKGINKLLTNFTFGGASSGIMCATETKEISLKHLPIEQYSLYYDHIIQRYNESVRICRVRQVSNLIQQKRIDKTRMKAVLEYKLRISNGCSLFCGGYNALDCMKILKALDIQVVNVYDNDKTKWGNVFCGVEIKEPKKMVNGEVIIVTTTKYENEICEQLESMGINTYICFREIIDVVSDYVSGVDGLF